MKNFGKETLNLNNKVCKNFKKKGEKIKLMEKEDISIWTVLSTMEIGLMINNMVKELKPGQMVLSIKVIM